MNLTRLQAATAPLFASLDAAKVPYDTHFCAFPTFFEFYIDMFEDEPPSSMSIVSGRLFTQRDFAENSQAISDALISAAITGVNVGHIVNPAHGAPRVDNAIHPAWRNASSFVITNVFMGGTEPWEEKKEKEAFNTDVVGKALRERVRMARRMSMRGICMSRIGRMRIGETITRGCRRLGRSGIRRACSLRRLRRARRAGAWLIMGGSCAGRCSDGCWRA